MDNDDENNANKSNKTKIKVEAVNGIANPAFPCSVHGCGGTECRRSCFSKRQWKNRHKKPPICLKCQQSINNTHPCTSAVDFDLDIVKKSNEASTTTKLSTSKSSSTSSSTTCTSSASSSSSTSSSSSSTSASSSCSSCGSKSSNSTRFDVSSNGHEAQEIMIVNLNGAKSAISGSSSVAVTRQSIVVGTDHSSQNILLEDHPINSEVHDKNDDMNETNRYIASIVETELDDSTSCAKSVLHSKESSSIGIIDQKIPRKNKKDKCMLSKAIIEATTTHARGDKKKCDLGDDHTFDDDSRSRFSDKHVHDRFSSDAIDEDSNTEQKQTDLKSEYAAAIPRKQRSNTVRQNAMKSKMKKSYLLKNYERSLYDEDDDGDDDDVNDVQTEHNVSLEALKMQILGRRLITESPSNLKATTTTTNNFSYSDSSKPLDAIVHRATTDRLRMDLSCPICHEILFQPVSLLCGHSFCRECIHWWIIQRRNNERISHNQQNEDDDQDRGAGSHQNCPTCRRCIILEETDVNNYAARRHRSSDNGVDDDEKWLDRVLCISKSLDTVISALFSNETSTRSMLQQKRQTRAVAGENDGKHLRGYEVLQPLDAESFQTVVFKTQHPLNYGSMGKQIIALGMDARRSVVLDAHDQRMQLCLALQGTPKIDYDPESDIGQNNNNVGCSIDCSGVYLTLDVCLLRMEEDEVEDGGFPLLLSDDNGEDEHFISVRDPNYYSTVDVTLISNHEAATTTRAGGEDGTFRIESHYVPITRKMLGEEGVVSFSIDLTKLLEGSSALQQPKPVRKMDRMVFRFCHAETSAELEIQIIFQNVKNSRTRFQKSSQTLDKDSNKDAVSTGAMYKTKTHYKSYTLDEVDEEEDFEENLNQYGDDGFVVNSDHEDETIPNDDFSNEEDVCRICKDGGDLIICDGGDHHEEVAGCGAAFHLTCVGLSMIPPGDWICETCARQDLGLVTGIQGHEFIDDSKSEDSSSREKRYPFGRKRSISESYDSNSDDDGVNEGNCGRNSAHASKRRVICGNDDYDETYGTKCDEESESGQSLSIYSNGAQRQEDCESEDENSSDDVFDTYGEKVMSDDNPPPSDKLVGRDCSDNDDDCFKDEKSTSQTASRRRVIVDSDDDD